MVLGATAAFGDEVTAFSGGDGTAFAVPYPSIVIASAQKAADNVSWTVSVYNTSGTSFGTTQNFIGAGVQANRPLTLVVYLGQPGTYYISGTPQDGDFFSGTVIPTTNLAEQSSVDAINNALSALQQQTTQNSSDITALQTLNGTLQGQISTLQGNVSTLQTEIAALQTSSTNTDTNLADLQSQIDALSQQITSAQSDITTLENLQSEVVALQNKPPPVIPAARKALSMGNYLIIGGVTLGAAGLGIAGYSLFFNHSSVPAAVPDIVVHDDVPDSYGDERLYSPNPSPAPDSTASLIDATPDAGAPPISEDTHDTSTSSK